MALKIVQGRQPGARWTHVYGVEGCGKTTFAAGAPSPLFLDLESGSLDMDVARYDFEGKLSWPKVLAALTELDSSHAYKTVVIDTVDALERLIWAEVSRKNNVSNIGLMDFQKGYALALDEWQVLVGHVLALRQRGISTVTIGHAVVKHFKAPTGEEYDRYQSGMHEKAAMLLRSRADVVLFATFGDRQGRKRGIGVTGVRELATERSAAFDAKNRMDLPPRLPLAWTDYAAACADRKPHDVSTLAVAIRKLAEEIGGEVGVKALAHLETYKADSRMLTQALTRLETIIAQRETPADPLEPTQEPQAAAVTETAKEPAPVPAPAPEPKSSPRATAPKAAAPTPTPSPAATPEPQTAANDQGDPEREAIQAEASSPVSTSSSDPFQELCDRTDRAATVAELDAIVKEARAMGLSAALKNKFAPHFTAARERITRKGAA